MNADAPAVASLSAAPAIDRERSIATTTLFALASVSAWSPATRRPFSRTVGGCDDGVAVTTEKRTVGYPLASTPRTSTGAATATAAATSAATATTRPSRSSVSAKTTKAPRMSATLIQAQPSRRSPRAPVSPRTTSTRPIAPMIALSARGI